MATKMVLKACKQLLHEPVLKLIFIINTGEQVYIKNKSFWTLTSVFLDTLPIVQSRIVLLS
jgi:hypothetical protein